MLFLRRALSRRMSPISVKFRVSTPKTCRIIYWKKTTDGNGHVSVWFQPTSPMGMERVYKQTGVTTWIMASVIIHPAHSEIHSSEHFFQFWSRVLHVLALVQGGWNTSVCQPVRDLLYSSVVRYLLVRTRSKLRQSGREQVTWNPASLADRFER